MSSPRRAKLEFYKNLPPLTLPQTKRKIMDLIAKRDHSAKEIHNKLKRRTEPETLAQALEWAQEQNWLPSESKMQEQITKTMSLRKKGQNALNLKLKQLGLAQVRLNPDDEIKIALRALESRFKSDILKGLDFKKYQKEKARVMRFLFGKGFTMSAIQQAVKIYFKI